ncbi:MAG: trehalase family glycosidase, partial [Candidatus Thermoplasmatota archaeon]|nr:trehalase family glycosidase [Candidatus Thermoplasmatota archaeon]
ASFKSFGHFGTSEIEFDVFDYMSIHATAFSTEQRMLAIEYNVSNKDSSPHSIKLGICQKTGSTDFPGYEQKYVQDKDAILNINGGFFVASKLSLRSSSHTASILPMTFQNGQFDNSSSATTYPSTSILPVTTGLGTDVITLNAGEEKTLYLIQGFGKSENEAFAAINSFKGSVWEVRQKWNDWLKTVPLPPTGVGRDIAKAWYYSWYTLEANRNESGLIYASPTHFRDVWLWDVCFAGWPFSLNDPGTAKRQAEFLLDVKEQDNGFIPHYDSSDITQPALVARLAWDAFASSGDIEWLKARIVKLEKYYDWMVANRIQSDGLFQAGRWDESGMDNSPIYDGFMPMKSVHMTACFYDYEKHMALIEKALGNDEKSKKWNDAAESTRSAMISKMWNEEQGWFFPLNAMDAQITTKTSDAFAALWFEVADDNQAKKMIAQIDSPLFVTEFGLATVATDDLRYNPDDYWRGPNWMVADAFLAEGLLRYDYRDTAIKILNIDAKNQLKYGDTQEIINTQTGDTAFNYEYKNPVYTRYASAPHLAMNAGQFITAVSYCFEDLARIDAGSGKILFTNIGTHCEEPSKGKYILTSDKPGNVMLIVKEGTSPKIDLNGNPVGANVEDGKVSIEIGEGRSEITTNIGKSNGFLGIPGFDVALALAGICASMLLVSISQRKKK